LQNHEKKLWWKCKNCGGNVSLVDISAAVLVHDLSNSQLPYAWHQQFDASASGDAVLSRMTSVMFSRSAAVVFIQFTFSSCLVLQNIFIDNLHHSVLIASL
jgi:hypothetical protein